MARVSEKMSVALTPDQAWEYASDLSKFDKWLTIHDAWRSPVPSRDELAEGLEVTSIVKVKGAPLRVDWKVERYVPPRKVVLRGAGSGVKISVTLDVEPEGNGSRVEFLVALGGPAMFGPVGMATAKMLKGDVAESLQNFNKLFT